jgi:hypothetical protein
LIDLFPFDSPDDGDDVPDQQVLLFDPLMTRLGYDPSDITMPASIGARACAAVLSFRHADGSNQLGDMNGGAPYSDYTGYLPVNTHNQINNPNHWQPLATGVLPDGTVTQQIFRAPHWGRVTPFALGNSEEHRPEPPAQYGTFDYFIDHEQELVDRGHPLPRDSPGSFRSIRMENASGTTSAGDPYLRVFLPMASCSPARASSRRGAPELV